MARQHNEAESTLILVRLQLVNAVLWPNAHKAHAFLG